jgi:hypothetical protein
MALPELRPTTATRIRDGLSKRCRHDRTTHVTTCARPDGTCQVRREQVDALLRTDVDVPGRFSWTECRVRAKVTGTASCTALTWRTQRGNEWRDSAGCGADAMADTDRDGDGGPPPSPPRNASWGAPARYRHTPRLPCVFGTGLLLPRSVQGRGWSGRVPRWASQAAPRG